jgi:hypothetical protein
MRSTYFAWYRTHRINKPHTPAQCRERYVWSSIMSRTISHPSSIHSWTEMTILTIKVPFSSLPDTYSWSTPVKYLIEIRCIENEYLSRTELRIIDRDKKTESEKMSMCLRKRIRSTRISPKLTSILKANNNWMMGIGISWFFRPICIAFSNLSHEKVHRLSTEWRSDDLRKDWER